MAATKGVKKAAVPSKNAPTPTVAGKVKAKSAPKPAVKPEPVAKAKTVPKTSTKAEPKTGAKAARPRSKKPAKVSAERRQNYIEVAAFYIAERRGFAPGNPLEDWVRAEAEIDRLIAEGLLGG